MMRLPLFSCALVAAALAVTAQAVPPAALSYQGRLNDAAGSPVDDGPVSLRFVIYNDSVSTLRANVLWDSGPVTVTTTDGLFSVLLGAAPMTALPDSLFADSSAWLGITVGAASEMSPRSRLAAVPYALSAKTADSLARDIYVHSSGDTVNGALGVTGEFSAGTAVFRDRSDWFDQTSPFSRISVIPGFGQVSVVGTDNLAKVDLVASAPSGMVTVRNNNGDASIVLDGGGSSGGIVTLRKSDGNYGAFLRGGNAGAGQGGNLSLWNGDTGVLPAISFEATNAGDNSVILPSGAINSFETEDEAGIASGVRSSSINLGNSMSDIVTVTITTPANGYIVLNANAQMETSGTTAINDVILQIDENEGGSVDPTHSVQFGLGGYVNTASNYFPMAVQRIYFREPGTYTFRIEGLFSSAGAGSATCRGARLTAMYFPSSYGPVSTLAPTPGDFPDARAVSISNGLRGDNGTTTSYEVDLSVLEQRAREARLAEIDAERARIQAEAELAEARRALAEAATGGQR